MNINTAFKSGGQNRNLLTCMAVDNK